MIDSGVDMNCIQEGLIPSKYFEKSIERLVSANGSQMKIKYELNNAHVCHENICFKIPFVLIKNLTDNSNIYIYTTSKWIIMASKGKAPVQDYSQPKRLLVGRPFKMYESASSGVKSKGTTSLQGDVLAEVTYSNGDIIIALQEVLARNLQSYC